MKKAGTREVPAFYAKLPIGELERVKGIEPSLEAWEAPVLPLNYTRIFVQTISQNGFRVLGGVSGVLTFGLSADSKLKREKLRVVSCSSVRRR